MLKSSFFLLQSICGALLQLRFWCALSLATARETLKSRMGSEEEEEEVDEGAVASCFWGLSWEFSCGEAKRSQWGKSALCFSPPPKAPQCRWGLVVPSGQSAGHKN